MAKFRNILVLINDKKILNQEIDIKLSKDEIFNICKIHPKDEIRNFDIGYICNWINSYLKYHIPEIKVLLYHDIIYITDNLEVTYDNIHSKYPSSNMYKNRFDFEIKRLKDTNFRIYKNCGISNNIIPELGVYIITTEEGQYIGTSKNICDRLRQHVSLLNNEDLEQKKTVKIRSSIKLITVYECGTEDFAKDLEEKLIIEKRPILN